jgi:hypothetical protein
MLDVQSILSLRESESLDFKREFHENNAELLHDILCLSNSYCEGDRFLVFGVANDGTVYGVENDPNKKTNADLHDFLRQARLNKIPQIELTVHRVDGHEIMALQIMNSPKKPYFILKDFQVGKVLVRAGVIYTRLGDTNIPVKETAPEDHIELMWKERFGMLKFQTMSLEEDIPVKLGDTRDRVFEVLGKADATGWQIEQYYSEGIEISYDQHFNTVDGLSVYPLPTGTAFEGTLFGIKLGDSFARVKEIIGRPSHWGLAYVNSSIAVWEIENKLLVVELWRSDYREKPPSPKQLGTVRSISYCNRKSYVGYNALVAIAIEQIKRGVTPPAFEKEDILMMDVELNSSTFDEDYELLGARQAIGGGAEVLVGFVKSKAVLAFWVYPLQWQYPVIRAVYKIKGESVTTSESA